MRPCSTGRAVGQNRVEVSISTTDLQAGDARLETGCKYLGRPRAAHRKTKQANAREWGGGPLLFFHLCNSGVAKQDNKNKHEKSPSLKLKLSNTSKKSKRSTSPLNHWMNLSAAGRAEFEILLFNVTLFSSNSGGKEGRPAGPRALRVPTYLPLQSSTGLPPSHQ